MSRRGVISCKRFEKLLTCERELDGLECELFEAHLAACRKHRRQMAENEAVVTPRLRAFYVACKEAFDSGLADDSRWEDLPSILKMAIDEKEVLLVGKIVGRCLRHVSDIRAIRLLLQVRNLCPNLRSRIEEHLHIETAVLPPAMILSLQQAWKGKRRGRQPGGRIATLGLLFFLDADNGVVVLEPAPAVVERG